jgi:hypothetical protein
MNKIVSNGSVHHLIDLKSREAMHLYYGLKNRFEYTVENREEVIKTIADDIRSFILQYDFVVYPESSASFISDVLSQINIPQYQVVKNSIDNVRKFSNTLNLQKKERESHEERFALMGPKFKINQMKSTQRVKYENVIFDKIELPSGRGLVVDDSHFSGTTYRALVSVTGVDEFLAIFSK